MKKMTIPNAITAITVLCGPENNLALSSVFNAASDFRVGRYSGGANVSLDLNDFAIFAAHHAHDADRLRYLNRAIGAGNGERLDDDIRAPFVEAGEVAFQSISGRLADAQRGTKSFPTPPRCRYRDPGKVSAWHYGYDRMAAAFGMAGH